MENRHRPALAHRIGRLRGLDQLRPVWRGGSTQNAHRRDYVGQPINAVVVRKWEDRVPQTGGTVYLTNGEVRDPFVVFDTYDWRSVIENGIFKEGKHPWHLLNFPSEPKLPWSCIAT